MSNQKDFRAPSGLGYRTFVLEQSKRASKCGISLVILSGPWLISMMRLCLRFSPRILNSASKMQSSILLIGHNYHEQTY
ncbi:hypothetical protein IEQ34_022472 [Dendrobium chrysotoxum]|uniref:Uncharacterized protein n=1 Tax=Dendrobium chrysotoxum TaxID=161865 RepID=A0AAV7FZ50_DENCH|nr:hypothetical protein IEQ34_022472 [Dendrobium chrysotoxum]